MQTASSLYDWYVRQKLRYGNSACRGIVHRTDHGPTRVYTFDYGVVDIYRPRDQLVLRHLVDSRQNVKAIMDDQMIITIPAKTTAFVTANNIRECANDNGTGLYDDAITTMLQNHKTQRLPRTIKLLSSVMLSSSKK